MSAKQSITAPYLKIAVYVGSPKYLGILQYLESPFISACQNITTFISHHQTSHKSLSLSALPTIMMLQLFELAEYHGIIISVLRVEKYLISLSVTCWEVSQLVIWQVPMKAECQIQPRTAVPRSSSRCRHIYAVKAQSGRNRHIKNMPKRPRCRTSLCWRHLMSVNRHKKYAHAGTMSIQQKAVDIRHIR